MSKLSVSDTVGTDAVTDAVTEASELVTETAEVPGDQPSAFPVGAFIGLGVCAAIGVALLIAVIVMIFRSPKKKAVSAVKIGKVHAIGQRSGQQDCFAVSPEELYSDRGVLAVVADGMGGLSDGDRVSGEVVTSMISGFLAGKLDPEKTLPTLLSAANAGVNRLLGANIGKSGSTVVSGLLKDGKFYYISVGDSRICLYRGGELIQLNREHIYKNELLTDAANGAGTVDGAGAHPKSSGLTSYLGMGRLKYVDIPAAPVEAYAGDKFILMSDGVYNALSNEELKNVLSENAERAAEEIGAMIEKKAHKGQDNYTAVIVSAV